MRKVGWMAVVLAGTVACTGGNETDQPGGGGDPDDPTTQVGGAEEQCEGYTDSETGEFTPVAGATGYFVGDFAFFDAGEQIEVEGTESWMLFPNDQWKEVNAEDAIECSMVWNAAGILDEEACGSGCDYRLILDMRLDQDATDCAPNFVNAHESEHNFTAEYDVVLRSCDPGPCEAEFVFAGSGNTLGTGQATANGATYVAGPSCNFF